MTCGEDIEDDRYGTRVAGLNRADSLILARVCVFSGSWACARDAVLCVPCDRLRKQAVTTPAVEGRVL